MRSAIIACGLAIFISLIPAVPVRAQTAGSNTAVPAPALSDQEIDARLDYLTQRLHEEEINADYWEYGWGAFNGGSMIWSAVQANEDHGTKNRNTDIVNSVEGFIGVADAVFRPLPAFDADSVCPKQLDTEEEREQCLAAKEDLLERSAARADEPYELLPHLGNLGFNMAAGLIVWRVADMGHALTTTIPGEIIGEIQLWTTPSGPLADLEQYKVKFSPMFIEQNDRTRSPTSGLVFTFDL